MMVTRAKALFIAAATGITALSFLAGGDPVLRILAAAVFVAGALAGQGGDDDTVVTLATGELLVIAVASASFYAGLAVQCAVIGAALLGGRAPAGRRDAPLFAAFCLAAIAGAVVLDRSNQILLPFLAMAGIVVAAALALTAIQELRVRRKYAGGGA